MVSLGGDSMLCLGDSILISRIGGEFSHRDEKQMSLFFLSRHTDPASVSSPRSVEPGPPPPPPPPGTGEEHEHHGKGGCPWAQSHDEGELFVGDTALGTELWAHGAGPSAPNFLME